jgi:AcrR family transcriptional regulator
MSTDSARRRLGRRGPRVREAVLDATIQALVANGLDGVSVADVAARAGVHETSIYRRWRVRENLIVDALLARSGEALPPPDTGSVRTDLITMLRGLAEFLDTPEGAALVRIGAVTVDDQRLAEGRRAFWTTRLDAARTVIERGVDRGELRSDTDAHLLLEMLVAPLHMRVLLTGEPWEPDLAERLVDLALAGVQESAAG